MDAQNSLLKVAQIVREEIEGFVIPEPDPRQLGLPLPPEWFVQQMREMRDALVEPYFAENEGDGRFPRSLPRITPRRVIIVAEDEDILVAYDPDPDGDFALIFRSASGFGLSPIRGRAIDCFMSR
jgi:hypothetical protein